VQALTKTSAEPEEDFEQTESRLHAASEKLEEASKAADESERFREFRLPAKEAYLTLARTEGGADSAHKVK